MGLRNLLWMALGMAALAGLVWALRPQPEAVETAEVARGPLEVTVDEEGETRVRDRYVVAAPIAGRVLRIDLDPGDAVAAGEVVARIQPAPLDRRTLAGAEARVEAALANQRAADAAVVRARAALAQAHRDAERMERLHVAGTVADDVFERARLEETTRQQELEAARYAARAAAHELEAARAVLLAAEGGGPADPACGGTDTCVAVRAPEGGRVLRVPVESERVVQAGEPLLEIGDPTRLEVVVDVLSADAVRIEPGALVRVEQWGGGEPLTGRVRRVEPSGFTKLSTLGVEEQRVNVVADLDDAPQTLGDGFRVEARIVTWSDDDVLRVPVSALFRHGDGWAVFVLEGGRAALREIEIGPRSATAARVDGGLEPGERVILHPGDRISEGVRAETRG